MRRLLVSLMLLLGLGVARAEEPAEGRFELQRTENFHFEWETGLEPQARALMEQAEAHHDRIFAELGVTASAPSRVTILRDRGRMLEVAARRHGGRAPPEWAEGLAYPATREIFLHTAVPPDELDETFQHEISHVAMGELGGVPRWFSEGVAIRQSEGLAFERVRLLTEAAMVGALLDLDDLNRGFPRSGQRAGVAYAQAVHFVGYLQSEYGLDRFQRLLAHLRDEGGGLARAVAAVYPVELAQIEDDWRSSLRIWWGWLPVLFGSTTLWAFMTVLLVMAWRKRKRQRAARLDQLKVAEAIEMAEDIEVAHGLEPPRDLHDPYDGRPPTIH